MFGLRFDIIAADADESSSERDPGALVRELSLRKARAVRELLRARGEWDEDTLIVASDTVVALEGEILGKPRDAEDAARMLRLLSGKTHHVMSGIAFLYGDREAVDSDATGVSFATLTERDIARYVATEEPLDKAGAYAVQGLASVFVKGLSGDYFNVVGLPVYKMNALLTDFLGVDLLDLGRVYR